MTHADTGMSVSSVSGKSRRRSITLIVATLSLLLTLLMPLQSTSAQESETALSWSAPRTVYIPQTGQTLDQLFLDLWRNAGGAQSFGYPITPEITLPNGHIVQYLQYARFEYWPEGDADGNTVLLGKLGEELRPINLQRTTASFSSRGQESISSTAQQSLAEAKAWLPIPTDPDPDDKSFVYVESSKHTIRGSFLEFWYATGGEDYLGNPLTEEFAKGETTYQTFERGQLRYTEEDGVSMVPIGQILADKYKLDQDPVPQGDIPEYDEALFIPPGPAYGRPDPSQELWVDINLSSQYMFVYSGNTPVLESYVSTGRPGFDTPTGTFYVQTMYDYDDMEGVLGGEYYNVPQVPDVLYFTGQGHAIHGAYWHNNFGAVMSHGCVNLPMDVADWLYSYAHIGMRIVIHY
jgi:lipoprotein-anchoring transpeptidase ErfK/SrfK